ncbi:HAMP domain-containing histidine kinase [Oscillospiraceae bacterium OttesenSCG-928-G22]|nr:HAMP domain-containing histidine kinase [Oscillospiraceae bacterium OttesenSCG-928-G22]
MKRLWMVVCEKYLHKRLDFRVRLFNVLAMAGMLVSLLMALLGVFSGAGFANGITNLVTAALSFALLTYSQRTGKYQLCYMVTIVAIFMVLFPVMFFSTGGYHSGMPCFFVFAVAFTVFMLEGKKAALFSLLELGIYIAICFVAYRYPQTVNWLDSEQAVLLDVVIAFVTVNVALGVSMYIHFRIYNQQQKQLAEQNAELNRAGRQKAMLLTDVSHEIRTPLAVISGYAQRARQQIAAGTVSEETLQGLLTIQLEAHRLAELSQQLISTPMVADATPPGPVNPRDVMEQAAALVRPILDKNRNALHLQVESDCPPIHAGAGMIAQVLVNLCVNANRHTQDDAIIIAAGLAGNGMVEFAVSDNGDGIDAALLRAVFERGVSGDGKSGLGLPICKEIVEAHGGEIGIASQPGEGTRVSFTLPASSAQKEGRT